MLLPMLLPVASLALVNAPEMSAVCGNQRVNLSGNVVSADVNLDSNRLVSGATGNWSATADLKVGNHNVDVVGNPTENLDFKVKPCEGGGVRNIPCHGLVAGHGLEQCQAQFGGSKFKVVPAGVGGCPAFVSMGCNVVEKSDEEKLIESLRAQIVELTAQIAKLTASRMQSWLLSH